MDHGLWIDAIQQSPTVGYVDPFYLMAESMRVRESADLDNLSPAGKQAGLNPSASEACDILQAFNERMLSGKWWSVTPAIDIRCVRRVLAAGLDQGDDKHLWKQVMKLIIKISQNRWIDTPSSHDEAALANSSEHYKDVDNLMREEAGLTHKRLDKFAHRSRPDIPHRRRLLGSRNVTVDEYSVLKQELNVGFVDASYPKCGLDDGNHPWPQILAPGRLKRKPGTDSAEEAWRDLAVCAGKILLAQTTRRFVVGFTICGTLMRVWVFDRLGSIASQQIDVNKEPIQFINVMLGFLWMSEADLGFDPTIQEIDGQSFIEIERKGIWNHPETPLVIKDSWQLPERDEEGELLKQATSRNVVNVARYYLHETVKIGGIIDDVRHCIRRGLDVSTASNYQQCLSQDSSGATINVLPQSMRLTSTGMSTKLPFDQTGSALPPSKKTCSESSRNAATDRETGPPNRVHRRVIVQDYGKPIYKASSRLALLACLEGCIKGHKSLYDNGVLHRDISITNLRINEDQDNPSWRSFLIDLDVAINAEREQPSGAQGRTGTTAFMAIGLLNGRKHSFAHDLESFFWVLFWICIHYDGPNKATTPSRFENWNYIPNNPLIESKLGLICTEGYFLEVAEKIFTPYYQPLIPHVNALRQEVFPLGNPQDECFPKLYSKMLRVLRQAQKDYKVLAE
ncbi:hypothetical protein E4U30_006001 [Claviceps sp. LM220 group G6]|nr:hypothetical protein E4U30_006001 [Claviceps sp. LM220 group G6]